MFRQFLRNFKYQVKDYLTFTQLEKKGSIASLIIIFILIISIVGVKFMPQRATDFSPFKSEIAALQKNNVYTDASLVNKENSSPANTVTKTTHVSDNEKSLFNFDPNNLPDSLWMKLGLTDKQIHVIKNYEAKGGKFYKKDDVKKMYCITPALYATLEPFITIESNYKKPFSASKIQKTDSINNRYKKDENPIKPIDLNIATEEQLDAVPGIGMYFANSIIKYRFRLGGYYDKKQLLELYNYSDSLYRVTEKHFTVNQVYVQQKNVNTDNKKELLHPYITYDLINRVVVYRKTTGNIDSFEKLKKAMQIDDATLEKIKPYIKFTD